MGEDARYIIFAITGVVFIYSILYFGTPMAETQTMVTDKISEGCKIIVNGTSILCEYEGLIHPEYFILFATASILWVSICGKLLFSGWFEK